MDHRQEKAERRRTLLYYLYLEELEVPGADEMVRKIGEEIEDPQGVKIEVTYPDGEKIIYYGYSTVQKRCRLGLDTLKKLLNNEEPDQKGRCYRYA